MAKVLVGGMDQMPDQPALGQPIIHRIPIMFYDLPGGATDRSEVVVEILTTDTRATLKSKALAQIQAKAQALGVTVAGADIIRLEA
jgi:hypothetical protein